MKRFRIGIDLGTTNCAVAYTALDDPQGATSVLAIPQPETAHSQGEWPTLPSFLYHPPRGSQEEWIAGRWARERALEVPGRVVHSAKSWLIHHATDRHARFLPLGADGDALLSPVEALTALLKTLETAWNAAHPDAPMAEQEVAITVPASFDPAAQQLTLEAAREAGLTDAILLEEPQAAFYAWLEAAGDQGEGLLDQKEGRVHVLVVDLGGGTTDFSLFAVERGDPVEPGEQQGPRLRRLAVSNHLLLGGDNLDLALAHHIEGRLETGDAGLPPTAFARLLAECRRIKEEALCEPPESERVWPVAVAMPGRSLLAGTLRAEVSAREIRRLLLEGFFPEVGPRERPATGGGGLREIGLPYAKEPAVTRHLAAFVRERPAIDALLCNGGLTKAPEIRERLLEHLARWQEGEKPRLLENRQPDLAVARGAARFLHLRAMGDPSRIEAGAASAYYLGVGDGKGLCVLPIGTAAEAPALAESRGLSALVGKAALFPLYRNTRRSGDGAGDLVRLDDTFASLPPVETLLSVPEGKEIPANPRVRVRVRTTLRATGLLRVELLCVEPGLHWPEPWPLEFSLRGAVPSGKESGAASGESASRTGASASLPTASEAMAQRIGAKASRGGKLTANAIFGAAEKVIGAARSDWTGGMVRELFDRWLPQARHRQVSPLHEEAWLQVAGYLMRPGLGMPGDTERINAFWPELGRAPFFPRKAVRLQRWICARRVAAGLNAERAIALWGEASAEWPDGGVPSAEVAQLAGALESLPVRLRGELARQLGEALLAEPDHVALWRGLGRLLSRALFHAGTGQIVPPERVVELWERLRRVEVGETIRPEAANAWLRAARLTGLRPLDLPGNVRRQIDDRLKKWGLNEVRRHPLHEVVPIVVAQQQSALLGESLPSGLVLEAS
ncbi:MAG TPA: Hsp70 family protein [Chthoniobacteraceae bacterium]|nr:Hsp70 family protein [Chthoniobacteraceae bacterium]